MACNDDINPMAAALQGKPPILKKTGRKGKKPEVNNRSERYLTALLTSNTQKEAAEKAGITPRRMREVMRDPEFAAEYKRRKAEIVDDATRRIQGLYQKAMNALESVIDDVTSSKRDRVNASRAILEYGQQFTETNEVMTRLDELERRTEDQ